MATTASANYGRPVTKGSRLVLQVGAFNIPLYSQYLTLGKLCMIEISSQINIFTQSGMLAVLGGGQDGRTGSEANREAKAASIKEDILL